MTDLDLAKIKEAVEKATPELVAALHSQRQLDFDGCEVGVSRQACDEAAEFIALARTAVPALIARLEASEARNATAYAEGVEAAAAIHTAEVARLEKQIEENIEYMRRVGRSDHSANNHCHEKLRQHLYYAEAIRALLKDKPNG